MAVRRSAQCPCNRRRRTAVHHARQRRTTVRRCQHACRVGSGAPRTRSTFRLPAWRPANRSDPDPPQAVRNIWPRPRPSYGSPVDAQRRGSTPRRPSTGQHHYRCTATDRALRPRTASRRTRRPC